MVSFPYSVKQRGAFGPLLLDEAIIFSYSLINKIKKLGSSPEKLL
jgi:hypothetical protein